MPINADDEEMDENNERTNDEHGEHLPGSSSERTQDKKKTSDGLKIVMRRSTMLQVVLTRIEDDLSLHRSPTLFEEQDELHQLHSFRE